MMMKIVLRLWIMGIQAGFLICIVLAVRACLKKYPKIYSCCLWIPVGLRLLCPVLAVIPPDLLPVPPLPGYEEILQYAMAPGQSVTEGETPSGQMPEDSMQAETAAIRQKGQDFPTESAINMADGRSGGKTGMTEEKDGLSAAVSGPAGSGNHTDVPERFKLPAILYLAVSACFLAFYLIQYVRIKRRLSAAVWKQENIWLNREIRSPFVMGVIAPKIYVPDGFFEDHFFTDSCFINNLRNNSCGEPGVWEKNFILEHERTHIRHHDPLTRMAGIGCICLYWWNPLVWLAVRKMNEDMEMFCDETVLRSAPAGERKDYASALLFYASKESGFQAGPAFGESDTEKRIKNICYRKKQSKKAGFAAFFLVLLCGAAFFLVPGHAAHSPAQRRQDAQAAPRVHHAGIKSSPSASQADIQPSSHLNEEYTGYMDECTEWTGYTAFTGQDYDGDGLTDRVVRTYRKDSGYCHYQILFGNNDVLDFDHDVYANGTPSIKAADINGDGKNEIIFTQQCITGTDMRAFGDLAVFEKKEGKGYQRSELPFEESGKEYSMKAPLRYQMRRERTITVSLQGTDFSVDVAVSNWLWEDAQYRDYYVDTSGAPAIWDVFLAEDGQDVRLACKVHLFDKWSDYGLILLTGYADGRYIVEDVILTTDEFSDMLPDTKQASKGKRAL